MVNTQTLQASSRALQPAAAIASAMAQGCAWLLPLWVQQGTGFGRPSTLPEHKQSQGAHAGWGREHSLWSLSTV